MTLTNRRIVAIAALLVASAVLVSGCTQKVRVTTGTRVTCTYGEVVTDTVRTIEVPADQADRYSVVDKTIVCDRHKRLEALYAAAQKALSAGDLATARRLLDQVTAQEPLFRKAGAQLADLKAGRRPAPDTAGPSSAPSSSPGSGDRQPVGPVANLSRFVPDALPGYRAETVVADVFTLTRTYVPTGSSDVESVVVVVEQYRNAAAAQKVVSSSIRPQYPVGPTTPSVSGLPGYTGTDGHRFAVVAWSDGGILVAVEASSRSRRPAGLRPALLAIASVIAE